MTSSRPRAVHREPEIAGRIAFPAIWTTSGRCYTQTSGDRIWVRTYAEDSYLLAKISGTFRPTRVTAQRSGAFTLVGLGIGGVWYLGPGLAKLLRLWSCGSSTRWLVRPHQSVVVRVRSHDGGELQVQIEGRYTAYGCGDAVHLGSGQVALA